jgi:hypothetical protein
MANKTAGKVAAELLKEWNIDHVYGMPGTASTNLSMNCGMKKTASASFKCAMKKPLLSLPQLMRS